MAMSKNIPPEILKLMKKEDKQKAVRKVNIYDFVMQYVNNDILELFGETGSGKTTFSLIFSKEASEKGLKVLFIDTERNLQKPPTWCDYKFIARYEDILKTIRDIENSNYDVIIIDSIGMPVLGHFALMSMKERGEALLGVQAILYALKNFCYKNPKRMALVTNQPESEFAKPQNHIYRPFGDKGQFFTKEIWKTKKVFSKPNETRITIETFRSRFAGMGKKLAEMIIRDDGVKFIGYG